MSLRLTCVLPFLFLTLIAYSQPDEAMNSDTPGFLQDYRVSYLRQETGLEISNTNNLLLYDTIATWLGTPYAYAGNCEKGIDCSGFVNVLYDRVYGKRLGARNSAEIYSEVQRIHKEELKEGDLVFFRIRRHRISHIGLYLSHNKFVHASTSRGVIISDLDEAYYKKNFAGAGRLKENIAEADENK